MASTFKFSGESKRERAGKDAKCVFCHEGEDSDDPDDDPLVSVVAGKKGKQYAHEECLWWCPQLTQGVDGSWQNVGSELSRCHRLKCAVCGEADAPLGCLRKSCRKNWHYPCAMEPTTGLVVYAEENCVACFICSEVLRRRARKKEKQNEEHFRAGRKKSVRLTDEEKIVAKYAAIARGEKPTDYGAATAPKSKASLAAPKAKPQQKAPVSKAAAKPNILSPLSDFNNKAPKASKPKGAAEPPHFAGAPFAVSKAAAKPNILSPLSDFNNKAPKASKPKGAAEPPHFAGAPFAAPPPANDGPLSADSEVAATQKIAELFLHSRADDLPLAEVRAAAQLSTDEELTELMKRLDAADKFMLYQERVYLI